jgi:hypothetical protein
MGTVSSSYYIDNRYSRLRHAIEQENIDQIKKEIDPSYSHNNKEAGIFSWFTSKLSWTSDSANLLNEPIDW